MPVSTRKKRIALVLALLAVVLGVALSTHRSLSRQQTEQAAASPLVAGAVMPDGLNLESPEGKATSLSSLKGKVLVINFWASWCTPCLHEMPGLYALQKKLGDKGLVVLGMNMDENTAAGLGVLQKVAGASPFANFKGMSSPIAERFALEGLPFTVIVDKSFKIVYAQPGEVDWGGEKAARLVGALL